MKVLQYISELLLQHDCVIVPGFGGFIATHVPAHIQPVINNFSPPKKDILFNSALKHNDGLLADYIAQKEKISFAEALDMIESFVEQSLQELKHHGRIEMLHVGTIYRDDNNFYTFQQDAEQNMLLSSFGLNTFISPAIQREGYEKRVEKVLAGRKIPQADRQSTGVWAKVAMISVPAAAIFVWGFINLGPLKEASDNYSNIASIFSGNSNKSTATARQVNKTNYIIADVYENTLDVEHSKSIFKPEQKTLYPVFTDFVSEASLLVVSKSTISSDTEPAIDTPDAPAMLCKFYIIGSCNRVKDLAENYKTRLISKGYANANILEPKGNGLYKVYIDCYDSEEAANEGLSAIQTNENPDAWLLKM
ncbi:MAG TPA: SPOR domain-containing protein [Bacteroidales bacterium]|nr:SPOR domain-containing protein [Bacteroidales bacterium]HNZ42542.1 SPOR domain-containing protein [Bacteroidales bacterium]HOH83521.1 SPOR domain-containing protein [Bacteroidales bacterium]HPB25900.1 SPOR domain-containing protein [Bacteroidales bacterium]HPI29049.1 SPOR domain-containing protein [Bacteroidales bacterium]